MADIPSLLFKKKTISSRSIQFLENTEEKTMKKSAIITLALSASLLSACSNSSASSSKTKQVLNWFSAGEISTMDPALNNDVYGGQQLDATMEGLVRLGNNSKILPGIAKSRKESKDGMTWTFNLRKNAKWSNGKPCRPGQQHDPSRRDRRRLWRESCENCGSFPRLFGQKGLDWGNQRNS